MRIGMVPAGGAACELAAGEVALAFGAGSACAAVALALGNPAAAAAFPLLALIALTDARTRRIPDLLSLPALALALAAAAMFMSNMCAAHSALGAAFGLTLGLGAVALRPHSAGLGDAKLYAIAGASFGWIAACAILLLAFAAMLGPAVRARRNGVPAAPAVAAACVAGLLGSALAHVPPLGF